MCYRAPLRALRRPRGRGLGRRDRDRLCGAIPHHRDRIGAGRPRARPRPASTTPRARSGSGPAASCGSFTFRCRARRSAGPALLVFVDCLKELPATLLLRPAQCRDAVDLPLPVRDTRQFRGGRARRPAHCRGRHRAGDPHGALFGPRPDAGGSAAALMLYRRDAPPSRAVAASLRLAGVPRRPIRRAWSRSWCRSRPAAAPT
jgi:hypothetical protein